MRVTVVPVILSGGSGSRLWPLSREGYPKQFWPLVGGARTMLQETAARAHGPGFAPPVVVCNEAHRFLVAEQLLEAKVEGARILLEPAARSSAPPIAAAALLLRQADPDAGLWLLAADQGGNGLRLHRDRRGTARPAAGPRGGPLHRKARRRNGGGPGRRRAAPVE